MRSKTVKLVLICLLGCTVLLLNVITPCLAANHRPKTKTVQKDDATPINVKSFGAKGDGATDDSYRIQKALNSLKSDETMFFPKGQYAFEKTISCFSFIDEYNYAIWNLSISGCYFENTGKCIDVEPNCSLYQLSDRPTDCFVGMMYFDTTLDRPIWWNGSSWVDADGRKK